MAERKAVRSNPTRFCAVLCGVAALALPLLLPSGVIGRATADPVPVEMNPHIPDAMTTFCPGGRGFSIAVVWCGRD